VVQKGYWHAPVEVTTLILKVELEIAPLVNVVLSILKFC